MKQKVFLIGVLTVVIVAFGLWMTGVNEVRSMSGKPNFRLERNGVGIEAIRLFDKLYFLSTFEGNVDVVCNSLAGKKLLIERFYVTRRRSYDVTVSDQECAS
jgi:hypothetical protein